MSLGVLLILSMAAIVFIAVLRAVWAGAVRRSESPWVWAERLSWLSGWGALVIGIAAIFVSIRLASSSPSGGSVAKEEYPNSRTTQDTQGYPTATKPPSQAPLSTATPVPPATPFSPKPNWAQIYAPTTIKVVAGKCDASEEGFIDLSTPAVVVRSQNQLTDEKERAKYVASYGPCTGGLWSMLSSAWSGKVGRDFEQSPTNCKDMAKSIVSAQSDELVPGFTICARSESGDVVAWAKIVSVGCPCSKGRSREIPTISMLVTAWRLAK